MSIFFPQPLNSQALDPLEIIMVAEWEGSNFSLGRKEMDLLCIDKLTQEKCQTKMKSCCSGEKMKKTLFLYFASGLETSGWLKRMGMKLL